MDHSIIFMIYFSIIVFLLLIRLIQIRLNQRLFHYFKDGPTGDAATYYFLIQFFRSYSCGVPDARCLLSNRPVSVPSIFMKVVSNIFSDEHLFKYSWLPNFLFYFLGVCFYTWVSFMFFADNYLCLVVASILFITQCDNMHFDLHRIHYLSLQPRFLGLVINSMFWMTYIIFGTGSVFSILLLLVMLFVALNVSIFSRQAVILLVPIFSIIDFNYELPLILAGAFLLSALAYPKEFLPSIKPQFEYSLQYLKNYYKPRAHSNKLVNFVKNSFSRALIIDSYWYFPFFLLCLLMISIKMDWLIALQGLNNDIIHRTFIYSIAVSVVFLLTGLRKFAFIGECWRYVSFTGYFAVPVILVYSVNGLKIEPEYRYLFLGIVVLANIVIILVDGSKKLENGNRFLLDLLKNYKSELSSTVWYSIPYRCATFPVALGYGKSTFEYQYGNHSIEIHEKYFSTYPYLKWDKSILSANQVTHVLVQKNVLKQAEELSDFSDSQLDLVEENDMYSLYKVRS
jgi:hypothetical protein